MPPPKLHRIWHPVAGSPSPHPGAAIGRAAKDIREAKQLSNEWRLRTLLAEGGIYADTDADVDLAAAPAWADNPGVPLFAGSSGYSRLPANWLICAAPGAPALAWLLKDPRATRARWANNALIEALIRCPHPWGYAPTAGWATHKNARPRRRP